MNKKVTNILFLLVGVIVGVLGMLLTTGELQEKLNQFSTFEFIEEGNQNISAISTEFHDVQGRFIWVQKDDGTVSVIKPPDPFDYGSFIFEIVEISPNGRFILVGIPVGDGGHAWVYDIHSETLHEIEGGFGIGELGWLENNRIFLHEGCVLATHCKRLESVNKETPWILKVVKDLGKYE